MPSHALRRHGAAGFRGLAAMIMFAVAVGAGTTAAAGPPPSHLVVAGLANPPRTAIAGTLFHTTDTTRNLGPGRARRASTTVFLASRSPRPGRGAVVLGARRVRPLDPGRGSHARRPITIPATTRPGTYWLIACAGASTRSRRYAPGACRTSRSRIRILSARPVNRSAPRIGGTTMDGATLTARDGAWRGLAPIAIRRQWQRCGGNGRSCAPIPTATAPAYALSAADVGSTIRVTVIGQNARGAGTAVSGATGAIRPAPPAVTAPPTISGAAVVGNAITASPGTWSGTPPFTYAMQWQRCDASGNGCADVPGAADSAYTVAAGDNGATLKVVVAAQNAGGIAVASSVPIIAGLFQNPVFPNDAPDPYVLDVGGTHSDYWAFVTGDRFPILRSGDLVHWAPAGRAMLVRPNWALQSGDWHPWAPSVIEAPPASCQGTDTGRCYVMYYVSLSTQYGVNCVAVATATRPGGPYFDRGPLTTSPDPGGTPQGCADANGRGNIDPSPFIDADGRAYLYTSTDFSPGGLRPTLSVTPLAPDLVHAAGDRIPLLSGDANTWETAGAPAPTIEGPNMVVRRGTYYLFYSAGSWRGAYGMGYATGPGPTGPFTKSPSNPILAQSGSVLSPGGGDTPVIGPHGGTWLLYHARANSYNEPRTLRLDQLVWQPGSPDTPLIAGPTSTAQSTLP